MRLSGDFPAILGSCGSGVQVTPVPDTRWTIRRTPRSPLKRSERLLVVQGGSGRVEMMRA